MLETMYVRCTHCGYDNSPEYRFCGMCGASLAHPPVAEAKAPIKEPVASNGGNGTTENVHGPSFLGLAEDPKVEFHYLYEDEPPRSHAGLIVFLILLCGAGGFGYWQWRNNGFPFNRFNTRASSSTASASPSEVAPAQAQDQQTKTDKPMTGVGDVLPTAPDQNAKPQTPPSNSTEFPAQGGQNAALAGAGSSTAGNNVSTGNPSQSASNPPAGNEQATPSDNAQESKPAKTEEAKATPPPAPAAKPRTPKVRAAKPAPKAAVVPGAQDADLELAGERYLYGNGVPQNCARATSNLQTAAAHGNSKAQTVLGTMYATGHCVGHDLPTAYRWFARALHQEPQNSRIADDLQVLWRQMSPQEKQLATAGR